MQPIPRQPIQKKNECDASHVTTVAESTSISVDQKGVQWDDMVSNLDNMRLSELNVECTMCDEAVVNSVENARESGVEGTLGQISMGSMDLEDSVMLGLGVSVLLVFLFGILFFINHFFLLPANFLHESFLI